MEKIDNITPPSTTGGQGTAGAGMNYVPPIETHHDRVQRHIDEAKTELRDFDKPRVQAVEPIRRFFEYSHLPAHLAAISEPFSVLADRILQLPASAERSVALRKLLEAKDATVRAALPG